VSGIGGAVRDFVRDHGLSAVLVLMALESCGIPIPSEVIMPVAGALAAGALGGSAHISLPAAIVLGAAGNLAGSLVAWALAARFGEPLLLGPGRWLGISRSHIELADRFFERRGLLAVLVGRVLPVIRTYISFPAGLARVDLARFSILTFVGALPWCAFLALIGYVLGRNYDRISRPIETAAVALAALVALVVIVWYLRGREPRGGKA
jgi:membrane protein DedA with SNARE-associated domain